MVPTGAVSDTDVLIQGYSNYLSALKKSPKTVLEYTKDVTRWAAWWKRPVEFFKQAEWDDWVFHLSSQGIAGSSINRYRSSLKRFYRYLRRRGIVSHEPNYDSESVGVEKRLPEICTVEEIQAMRRRIKALRMKALFALLYDCGLRNKEARELHYTRVGLESIHVSGKRAKDRIIPITAETSSILQAWLKRRPEGTEWLFPTLAGNPIAEVAVHKFVVRIAKGAGVLKRISPHSLRHSIATHLLQGSWKLERLQAFLGHDSIETTRRYVRLAQTDLRAAVAEYHPSQQR